MKKYKGSAEGVNFLIEVDDEIRKYGFFTTRIGVGSRVVDLTGLVECLTHERLPDDVAIEILELINSTLENCGHASPNI